MTMTRKKMIFSLVTVFLICIVFFISVFFNRHFTVASQMNVDAEVYEDAEHTLKGFLGMKDDGQGGKFRKHRSDKSEEELIGDEGSRMTQRVTIVSDSGVLPISGTVTKAQDAYYPGTYELKFGNNAMLTSEADIYVSLNVKRGDKVYILTGDRENGYVEYKMIEAQEDNRISFGTNIIQDYTISTTDIISAQEAMAMLVNQ